MFKLSTVSLFPILLFSIIARGALSFDAKSRARLVPPVSGETTTILSIFLSKKYLANIGRAVSSSTVEEKNPCTCPACKSMSITLSAPAVVIKSAIKRPVMGTLG